MSLRAEIVFTTVSGVEKPGMTPLADPRGGRKWVGAPLVTFPNPTAVSIERKKLLYANVRNGNFMWWRTPLLNLGLTEAQKAELAAKLPSDKTSQLAAVIDGFLIGVTPQTRNWLKWESTVGQLYPALSYDLETAFLKKVGIPVTGSVVEDAEEIRENLERKKLFELSGSIETMICRSIVDNPLQARVSPPTTTVLCGEPVQAAISVRNIGIDQSAFPVGVRDIGVPASNLRVITGKVLAADPGHETPKRGEDRRMLQEGEGSTNDVNLTRALGCEYAKAGTGPLALQFRLEVPAGLLNSPHNYEAWLDLPAAEVKAVAFEETQFQARQTVAVTGMNDTVRLGTHLVDGKMVTVAVYSKDNAVRRILRLDPNPDTKAWEMAWDSKAQQLHILGRGTKTRYWMSAADQLGWEVRADMGDRSKLETTEGQVRRVE